MTLRDDIDRLSPTLEPDLPVVLHQSWHHLGFFHWEVPPAELQKLLPAGLTVDTFDGKAWVGLVPFTLSGVRPVIAPPLPWISQFHEVNVRTYVHHGGRDPGVWFFSLDASSRIAVEAARVSYKLPYFDASIHFTVEGGALPAVAMDVTRTDSRGTLPAGAHLAYRPVEGPAAPASPGTIEHFLVERYVLYSEGSDRRLHRARIHHQPYPLQRAEIGRLEETLVWAAGIRRPENVPLRHYARQVDVKVYPLEEVPLEG